MSFLFRFFCVLIIGFSSIALATYDGEDGPQQVNNSSSEEKTIYGITEEQLDSLFEDSFHYVILTSATHIHRVNQKWTDVLGWTPKEITSQPFIEFLHPEDVLSSKEAAYLASNITCLINYRNRYLSKKGAYHLIEWLTLLQVSGTARDTPLLAIGKDLTLEEEAEKQKHALAEAEASTKLKSNFVAHMSHELRTPLNGILGFLGLALEEEMPESVRGYVQHAEESSHLLLNLANDILDVSKIEADVLKIENIEFNPFIAIKSTIELLKSQADKNNLTLKFSIDRQIPPVLKGDENRLKQILFNLLGNALKFTREGNVSLKIKGKARDSIPPTFLLQGRVKDTGIGIAEDFLPKLFQPFSQEDHSMRRQFGGSGLGLYITKQLCEKMGGTINVLSTLEVGTTFQFHIILEQPALRSPDRSKILLRETPDVETLPPYKILLVEDNKTNQLVASLMLRKLSCSVSVVENGLLALEAVQKNKYDLILMDGEMPVMDGLQAARKLRENYSKEELPIIGLSAHAMLTHREQFLESGMNGYVSKPINKKALIEEILRCTQK